VNLEENIEKITGLACVEKGSVSQKDITLNANRKVRDIFTEGKNR